MYADDTLTCGSGAAGLVFDLSGAFDGKGKPRGTPLPCSVRPSSTAAITTTRAMVTDCLVGANGRSLSLRTSTPTTAAEAWQRPHARRATPRTGVEETVCTAHVFQQIPGQNRIFMGWYSQGTQVVDFEERADGTIAFREAGWFIPEKANTWVSHVFKMRENADGTFTYRGATGDFLLGTTGRSAIDVWQVTLPAPPKPGAAGGRKKGK